MNDPQKIKHEAVAHTDNLSRGGQLLIWSMREWARAARHRECVCAELNQAYSVAGCPNAVGFMDEYMSLIAIAARRPVDIRCPGCGDLSDDERLLLSVLLALQTGRESEALLLIGGLIGGCIGLSFCRVAVLYVEELKKTRLLLSQPRRLQLVK